MRVAVDGRRVAALEGGFGGPLALRLTEGDMVTLKAFFLMPRQSSGPLTASLGLKMNETPHGLLIRTDAAKRTSMPGELRRGCPPMSRWP
jgi:hypothetical protein